MRVAEVVVTHSGERRDRRRLWYPRRGDQPRLRSPGHLTEDQALHRPP